MGSAVSVTVANSVMEEIEQLLSLILHSPEEDTLMSMTMVQLSNVHVISLNWFKCGSSLLKRTKRTEDASRGLFTTEFVNTFKIKSLLAR